MCFISKMNAQFVKVCKQIICGGQLLMICFTEIEIITY